MLLGAICWDQSCLIFKIIENRKLGAEIFLLLSNRKVYRMEIAFVDDTDMYLNGKLSAKNIQMIMDIYTRLYEAIGGKI